jgi:hypothetical protein
MAGILTLGKTMYPPPIPSHQSLLLLATPALNLLFPNIGILDSLALLTENQFDRQTLGGVPGAQAVSVLPQPPLEVPGAAGVVAAVGAFEDVDVGHG